MKWTAFNWMTFTFALLPGHLSRRERVLEAIYLELKTDNLEEMKQKILAFGVNKLDVPDPHLYFQAPGGQVSKLVGISEDLSSYEESTSSRPGSSAPAS